MKEKYSTIEMQTLMLKQLAANSYIYNRRLFRIILSSILRYRPDRKKRKEDTFEFIAKDELETFQFPTALRRLRAIR